MVFGRDSFCNLGENEVCTFLQDVPVDFDVSVRVGHALLQRLELPKCSEHDSRPYLEWGARQAAHGAASPSFHQDDWYFTASSGQLLAPGLNINPHGRDVALVLHASQRSVLKHRGDRLYNGNTPLFQRRERRNFWVTWSNIRLFPALSSLQPGCRDFFLELWWAKKSEKPKMD